MKTSAEQLSIVKSFSLSAIIVGGTWIGLEFEAGLGLPLGLLAPGLGKV